jgi:CxxC-x17-CxxC domain-containing protein
MEYSDKTLTCVECGQPFVFSVGEQIFFSEKQFQNDPKRCKKCKAKRTNVRARTETSVTCAACGAPTVVPFVPRELRPVLCRACFHSQWSDAWLKARVSEQVEAVEDRSQRLPGGGKLVS